MKQFFILVVMLFFICPVFAQKAFGPINFGMTKNEVKQAVQSSNNVVWAMGQIKTKILGHDYFGKCKYDQSGLVEIEFKNEEGAGSSFGSSFGKYNIDDLENEINNLSAFFNEEFGKPVVYNGFIHPGDLVLRDQKIIGRWINDNAVVSLYEINFGSATIPKIVISEKSYFENNSNDDIDKKNTDKEQTKKMF